MPHDVTLTVGQGDGTLRVGGRQKVVPVEGCFSVGAFTVAVVNDAQRASLCAQWHEHLFVAVLLCDKRRCSALQLNGLTIAAAYIGGVRLS